MGLFDFVKEAGERLGLGKDEGAAAAASAEAAVRENAEETAMTVGLLRMVRGLDIEVDDLYINFNDGVARVSDKTATQEAREKVILATGNVFGVARVDDKIEVVAPEPEAAFYTVVSGDTLGKIAKEQYGNAMKYPVIFEANRPMLSDPDKIYPGQVLRIPATED